MNRSITHNKSYPSIIFAAIFIVAVAVFASACGWSGEPIDADKLDYKDTQIEIVGLNGEEDVLLITPSDLAALDCVDREIKTKNTYGTNQIVIATGPLLSVFLEKFGDGRKQEDFETISFEGSDGYVAELSGEELDNCRVILSIMKGDEALAGEEKPMRVITTKTDASYWVSGVIRIIFE